MEEVKGVDRGSWSVIRESLKSARAFYENAERREIKMFENLSKLLRATNHKSRATILIAGGFHTEGLAKRLKEEGISYVVVMPHISQVPEQIRYREHMRGEASWEDYFEVENGKINLYKAFVRAIRDRLLTESLQNGLNA